jgi:hypothetical protein
MIRELDAESISHQTATSATQFVGFPFNREKVENLRVDGLIHAGCGTGESAQLGKIAALPRFLSVQTVRRQNLLDKFALELREDLVHLS